MKNHFSMTGLLVWLTVFPALAQVPVQQIRGSVRDAQTRETLPGANVVLMGESRGTITNEEGRFLLEDVPVGRYNLQVSYVGYTPEILPELLVTSGSALVLEVSLEPSLSDIGEVVIRPAIRKDRPGNSMAAVSARRFSVEEAGRYAGAIEDPGRMAGSFAGVTAVGPHLNAIVVRGNAPKGLSWRLEGVDIPVPSHFSGSNVAGGGGLTIFSSQLLANSDFYTGAFPAAYGNATAGVFDMRLRNGNSYNHEYAVKLGVQGVEAAAEGPLLGKGRGSYLANYRYSTMALIFPLLPEVSYANEVPVYQDLSFKASVPAGRAGTFSLWGIGGLSSSTMEGYEDRDQWIYPENREQMTFNYNMGATGLSHAVNLADNTYLHSTLSFSGSEHKYHEQSRLDTLNTGILFPLYRISKVSSQVSFSSRLTHSFSDRIILQGGWDFQNHHYTLDGASRDFLTDGLVSTMDGAGNSWLAEAYIQGKYKWGEHLYTTGGLHMSWFELNQSYTLEPRVSASWQVFPGHRISLGYGNHSQIEPLFVYHVTRIDSASNQVTFPNRDLKRMRAHHFVMGYDWTITPNIRLKIEPYYQRLYRVPVVSGTPYSMVNFLSDWAFSRDLVNEGKGTNTGIDFTLERFLKKGLYYMITASVYDSKYTGGDGIRRRTRYDGGYVVNILGGKEWEIRDKDLLGINVKVTFMGPYWHQPVDPAATRRQATIVYDQDQAFTYRHSGFESLTDLTVNYRMNGQSASLVLAVQVKNILGRQYLGKKYNLVTGAIENDFFTSPVPFISAKLAF